MRLTQENWDDLRALGRLLSGYKKRIALAGGTMLLSVLLQLPLPFLTMLIIDHLIKSQDLSLFSLILCGVMALIFFSSLVGLVHGLLLALLREHFLGTLEMRVIERLHRTPVSFFYNNSSGYLAARIRGDLRSLNALLAGPLLAALQSSMMLIGGTASMFFLSWKLALVCFAILPFFMLSVLLFNREIRRKSLTLQESRARFGSDLQEGVTTIPLIKAFAAEDLSVGRLRRSLLGLIHNLLRLEMTGNIARRVNNILGMVAPLIVLWYGASEYLAGRMTIGQFVAFHAFLGYVFGPVQGLLSQNIEIQSALVALHRVLDMLRLPVEGPSVIVRPMPAANDLCLDSVSFGYRPDRPILQGLDLDLAEGEAVALMGPSGQGKTTLLRLLLRFHDPTQGRILLGGRDVRELDLAEYRSRFSVVFQEPHLWSGTVDENLRIGRRDFTEKEIRTALEGAAAWDFVRELPDGLGTKLGEGGVTLSAGQKMRLAIARALLRDAPIFLLDEPISNLDHDTAREVLGNLRHHLHGRTALLISHQPELMELADRVASVRDGRLVPFGEISPPLTAEAGGAAS